MIKIYGIKNCDTMKKAIRWLDDAGVEYEFHDYKKNGLPLKLAEQWLAEHGWENVINRRGTTWRKLPDDVKSKMDNALALTVMAENPSIVKRPILDTGDQRILGFKDDTYRSIFQ